MGTRPWGKWGQELGRKGFGVLGLAVGFPEHWLRRGHQAEMRWKEHWLGQRAEDVPHHLPGVCLTGGAPDLLELLASTVFKCISLATFTLAFY